MRSTGRRSRASCPTRRDGRLRKSALASSFVAALELARQGRVDLRQQSPFAPLYLRAAGMKAPDDCRPRGRGGAVRRRRAADAPATSPRMSATAATSRARWPRSATDYAGRGIELVERGGRWHFQTAADLAHLLRRDREEPRKLSRARRSRRWRSSPITSRSAAPRSRRSAACRSSKGTLDVLMEAGWVRPAGRREVPGRPLTYATTAGLPDAFRPGQPPRPARDRRSARGGAARSGRSRVREATCGGKATTRTPR